MQLFNCAVFPIHFLSIKILIHEGAALETDRKSCHSKILIGLLFHTCEHILILDMGFMLWCDPAHWNS